MTKPINLNAYRKARAKADKRRRGDENAARFGRSRAQRNTEAKETETRIRRLDGHTLQKPGTGEDDAT